MRIQNQIQEKLTTAFEPFHLEVVNESDNHSVPPGSESHFKVLMVSKSFDGKNAVARHRMVNKVLVEELEGGVHALSLKLWTPAQWDAAGQQISSQSPECASKR